jgi:hypothetical protein
VRSVKPKRDLGYSLGVTLIDDLDGMRDLEAAGITPHARGYRFERWLQLLLTEAGLEPRGGYRPVGEQIDGSFVLGGRMFLLEAKWVKDPVPASALYAFKGKVDGKLAGTIGIFISMSGFSDDAIEALRIGKDLNILLANDADVTQAARAGVSAMLLFKLRAAAEGGEVSASFAPRRVSLTKDPYTSCPRRIGHPPRRKRSSSKVVATSLRWRTSPAEYCGKPVLAAASMCSSPTGGAEFRAWSRLSPRGIHDGRPSRLSTRTEWIPPTANARFLETTACRGCLSR